VSFPTTSGLRSSELTDDEYSASIGSNNLAPLGRDSLNSLAPLAAIWLFQIYRVDDMLVDDFVMQLYQQSNTAELPFLRHMKALNFLYKISLLTLAEFREKTWKKRQLKAQETNWLPPPPSGKSGAELIETLEDQFGWCLGNYLSC
jgi:hypothetical protein